MSKALAGIESRESVLRRLAIAFADPLRLKIVTELYMREMSPTRFHEEFGGGSVARVDRHFKRLAEHGWLELVRKATGGRRRGATEYFYRATQLAVFDQDTWAALPHSIRVAFSWRTLEQLTERVRAAIDAGTFDARSDRHHSWTPVLLDEAGWVRVLAALRALFDSLFEEQADAKLRIAGSAEEPILATVALAAFESPLRRPAPGDWIGRSGVVPVAVSSPVPFGQRLAKVFANPLNLKIVTELNLREMSPTQFHCEFGEASVSALDRRFKMLAELGWLAKAGEKTGGRRRGATEYFYRATGPAVYDRDSWSEVPDAVKATYSWRTFEQFSAKVREALDAGTFDARPERHQTWSLLLLDQAGWERVIAGVEALFELLFEEQLGAKLRLADSGEEPILTTIGLSAFESPKGPKAH